MPHYARAIDCGTRSRLDACHAAHAQRGRSAGPTESTKDHDMRKIALVAFALAASPAWASPDPYRYSDTHAGGPADNLISATGGRPKPVRKVYVNRAYR